MTPPAAAAVILFPDEYGPDAAIGALAALRKARPDVLAVIVTNDPRRFGDARAGSRDLAARDAEAGLGLDDHGRRPRQPRRETREHARDPRPGARRPGRHE